MFCEYGPVSTLAVLELLITSHCLHQQMERPQLSLDCRCSNVKNFFFLKQTRSPLNVFIVQQIECFLSRRFEKTNIFRTAVSGLWVFSKIGRWLVCDVKYMITMNKLRFVPVILWPDAALGIDKWQVVWKVVFCRCSAATSTVLTTTEWKLHARVHHIHPSTLLWFFFFFFGVSFSSGYAD